MNKRSSPAYTMSSRLKETIDKIVPGPMTYRENISIIKPSGPKPIIGKAPRQTFKSSFGPAPGQYDIQKAPRPKSSSVVFPTSRQLPTKQTQKKLGPGCYEPNYQKIFRKTLSECKFGRSSKFYSKEDSKNIPGPMAYDPKFEIILNNSPGVKFGRSKREDAAKIKQFIPGPAKYISQKIKTHPSEPSFKFPNEKRETFKIQKNSPGPLDYTIQSQFNANLKKNKGFKIIPHSIKDSSRISVPGPNAYNSQRKIILKRAPAFSISHSQRKNNFSKIETLAPNNYNPNLEPKKRSGSALITSSKRETEILLQKKKTIPGPGAYEKAYQYKTMGTGPKFTIPQSKIEKQKQLKSQRRPGPWSYNPIDSLKQSLKFGIMGKSRRQSTQKKGLPGPGDYYIKEQRKPGVVIGKQKRSKEKESQIPGPNSYIIPSTIGNLPIYQKSAKK